MSDIYWKAKSAANDLAYQLACLRSWADDFGRDYTEQVEKEVEKFLVSAELTASYNVGKKAKQIWNLIGSEPFAYDLPEHPEKHNGFANDVAIIAKILQLFGIAKSEGDSE